jgi:F420-dependent oxidoreductase-like protein
MMHLGVKLAYDGNRLSEVVALAEHADRVGFDSVWTAEAYGADAATVLAYLAGRTERIGLGSGIMQMPARTPANTAMTAMTIDALSNGRFLLGLGASGPQVVEGWHGVAYGRPLQRTREYVDVVRQVIARTGPVTFTGTHYQVPYEGPDATGLGKPLRSTMHPVRSRIPIFLAAIGPKNVALAAEIADGWLPTFCNPEQPDVLEESIAAGLARSGRSRSEFTVLPTAYVHVGDDLEECRDVLRPYFSLYIGGMGARGRNFYFDLVCRYGFEEIAHKVQDLYLSGHQHDATALIPAEMIDAMCLVGSIERIADRLGAWKASGIDGLLLRSEQPEYFEALRGLA